MKEVKIYFSIEVDDEFIEFTSAEDGRFTLDVKLVGPRASILLTKNRLVTIKSFIDQALEKLQ